MAPGVANGAGSYKLNSGIAVITWWGTINARPDGPGEGVTGAIGGFQGAP
jgi:hypothetical protein